MITVQDKSGASRPVSIQDLRLAAEGKPVSATPATQANPARAQAYANFMGPTGPSYGTSSSGGQKGPFTPADFSLATTTRNRIYNLVPTAAQTVGTAAQLQTGAYAQGSPGAGQTMYEYGVSPVSGAASTPQYQSFLSSYGLNSMGDPSSGLSSAGKYGGFYSASDLESAIAGQAQYARQAMIDAYRKAAGERMTQLDTGYRTGLHEYDTFRGPTIGKLDKQSKVLRGALDPADLKAMKPIAYEYRKDLENWYAENAAPAEQYYQTAKQIEATPLSQLATAIATQQYGMNPYLAYSKFAGLDATAYENEQDRLYIEQYGMPKQQFLDLQEQAQNTADLERKYTDQAIIDQIEGVTHLNASNLRNITGKSYTELNRQLANVQTMYDFGNEEAGNAATAINTSLEMLNAGKVDDAKKLVETISKQNTSLAQIIGAILGQTVKGQQAFQDYMVYAPGLFTP